MDDATIKRLNLINQDFYRTTADSFNESRGSPWPGWERLLPHLQAPLSILDIGCGNGRFGRFLADHFGTAKIHYHGIDNNPTLLQNARDTLADLPDISLLERDILTLLVDPSRRPAGEGSGARADIVVLFGILHHIPGVDQRRDLIHYAANCIVPGGLLVFACWRFMEYERFRARTVPWPDDLRDKVEPNDYLLDWRRGESALRYCHYVDDAEHADLIAVSGLQEIATYRADGDSGDMNRYSLLRHSRLGK